MNKLMKLLAMLAALTLFAAACSSGDAETTATADGDSEESADDSSGDEEEAMEDEEEVAVTQGGDLTFHMITHSDDGPFWSVVQRGMEAACDDLGVNCCLLYTSDAADE